MDGNENFTTQEKIQDFFRGALWVVGLNGGLGFLLFLCAYSLGTWYPRSSLDSLLLGLAMFAVPAIFWILNISLLRHLKRQHPWESNGAWIAFYVLLLPLLLLSGCCAFGGITQMVDGLT
jgi:hypothetical protein